MVKLRITPDKKDTDSKSGFDRIIEFFNETLGVNHPVTIKEVVEKTGLSYTFVKKTLDKLKEENYCGFHYEQSASTWIAWKDERVIMSQEDFHCGAELKITPSEEWKSGSSPKDGVDLVVDFFNNQVSQHEKIKLFDLIERTNTSKNFLKWVLTQEKIQGIHYDRSEENWTITKETDKVYKR